MSTNLFKVAVAGSIFFMFGCQSGAYRQGVPSPESQSSTGTTHPLTNDSAPSSAPSPSAAKKPAPKPSASAPEDQGSKPIPYPRPSQSPSASTKPCPYASPKSPVQSAGSKPCPYSAGNSQPSVPTPSPTSVDLRDLYGSAAMDDQEVAFLEIINQYRAQHGLPKLEISVELTRASDWLSADMASHNYFSHSDRYGRTFSQRVNEFMEISGRTMGENIAAGNESAQATFEQWKNSPGHNANMLHSKFLKIGIARAYLDGSSYRWYWTTDFSSN